MLIEKNTMLWPWNEAARAMSHVKGRGRIRQSLGGENANESRNPSLQSELNLSFVGVPWRKRHGYNVP